jgi:hypothetical protein
MNCSDAEAVDADELARISPRRRGTNPRNSLTKRRCEVSIALTDSPIWIWLSNWLVGVTDPVTGTGYNRRGQSVNIRHSISTCAGALRLRAPPPIRATARPRRSLGEGGHPQRLPALARSLAPADRGDRPLSHEDNHLRASVSAPSGKYSTGAFRSPAPANIMAWLFHLSLPTIAIR